jgi:hypothetical protein
MIWKREEGRGKREEGRGKRRSWGIGRKSFVSWVGEAETGIVPIVHTDNYLY